MRSPRSWVCRAAMATPGPDRRPGRGPGRHPHPLPGARYLVRAAIAGGKDVYSEWPLTTSTAESEELLQLAEERGVRHVVGLQRRFAPSASYAHDLIAQGYVGTIRGVSMSVGVDAFAPSVPERYQWTIDEANFTNVLSIYAGHFFDLLFHIVGRPGKFVAITQNQFPTTAIVETGEQVPNSSADEVVVIGALQQTGLFAIQIEGAQTHRTGLQIDITGTDGVLRITNPRAFQNKQDNTLEGMRDGATTFAPLPVPDEYAPLGSPDLDVSSLDTAYLYAAYARDRATGTSDASNFHDAVRLHQMIDRVIATSHTFFSDKDTPNDWHLDAASSDPRRHHRRRMVGSGRPPSRSAVPRPLHCCRCLEQTQCSSEELAATFGIDHAFDDAHQLIGSS